VNTLEKSIYLQKSALWAKKITQERDIGLLEGTKNASCFSIASFNNELIHTRAAMLGVSLGSSPSEIESSIGMIKDLDLNRTMIMLKKRTWTKN
jgi:hypothetical protein